MAGEGSSSGSTRVFIWPVHFIVQQGLTQHDKAIMLQKRKKISFPFLSFFSLKKRRETVTGHVMVAMDGKSDLQDLCRSAVSQELWFMTY